MKNAASNAFLLCAAAAMALAALPAAAQRAADYPNKPVRIILPYATGGGTNAVTRIFADALSKDTGQPFIVDNRPGGSTIIGTQAVTRANPDGYTLLVATATLLVNHWTQPNLPYDTLKDLVGVSPLIRNAHMIAVHPSLPAGNLRELIAYARKTPGRINAAVTGLGSYDHLETLLFMKATNTKYTIVPYKGSDTAAADLLSGAVQMAFNTPNFAAPLIRAGKLKGIAISGESRNAALPEVPTFAEGGLQGFVAGTWYVLLAPAATPRDIVEKLNAYAGRIQSSRDVQESLAKRGMDPFPYSVAATNAMLRSELETWGKVIKENGIKAVDE